MDDEVEWKLNYKSRTQLLFIRHCMPELSTRYPSYIQYLLMPLKIKNPTALKTEDEQISSHRTFLTTVCDSHVYCNSSHIFFLSPSKQDAQYPNITSDNTAYVMKS
jgi:hypothetical protein